MVNNVLVSIRPDYELVTRYGASWMTQILNSANSRGLPFIDLYKEEATRSNFENAIVEYDPELVSILGHGASNLIVCQNNELLLTGGQNTNILSGRVVYDLSCQAGRDLGANAFNEGAISFLGYTEDFWMCYNEGNAEDGGMINPLEDQIAQGFLESHTIAPISYINGSTIPQSYNISQARFDYWIKVWEQVDSQVAALIMWNKDYQILYYEGGVVSPQPTQAGSNIAPALLMFAPLLAIPFLKNK